MPLIFCASKLDADLWTDEIYTLTQYVSRSVAEITGLDPRGRSDYSPNNQVGYTLLLRPFYLLSDSTVVLRSVSLICSFGTLAFVFRIGAKWAGVACGSLASLVVGLSQMFLGHTMQLRGYSLSMMQAAWLAELAMCPPAARTWRRAASTTLLGAWFIYTVPTNVLFLLPMALLAVVVCLSKRSTTRSVAAEAATWVAALLTAAVAYFPIWREVLAAGNDQTPATWSYVARLTGQVLSVACRDYAPLAPLVGFGLVCWIAKVRNSLTFSACLVPIVVVTMILGPFVLTRLLVTGLYPRNFCPLVPFIGLGIGWTMSELLAAVRCRIPVRWSESAWIMGGAVIILAALLPPLWTYPQRLTEVRKTRFAQDGYYNYYAANYHPAAVAAWLHTAFQTGERFLLCFSEADHFNLRYYLDRAGVPLAATGEQGSRLVVYVVAPDLSDLAALAERYQPLGLQEAALRDNALVRDFGYYGLYRLRRTIEILSTDIKPQQ